MLFPDEPAVYEVVQQLRKIFPIMLTGCAATSELEPFGTSFPKLLAVADEVIWCKADCEICGARESATRSFYTKGKKTVQVAVGGEESYRPLCVGCWSYASTG
jgi:thymidine kinase